jgi:hypothetical protein
MRPDIETVRFSFALPEREEKPRLSPVLDETVDAEGPCLRCPVEFCRWRWELRAREYRFENEVEIGTREWEHHYATLHDDKSAARSVFHWGDKDEGREV